MIIDIFSRIKSAALLLIILIAYTFIIPVVFAASPNDACFNGQCHNSTGPGIDRTLYDSNPHRIINCIDCHVDSINNSDSDHGQFIRQLNGSKITGPLLTQYYSQNFSLCYSCHNETKLIGVLSNYNMSSKHVNNKTVVASIGTNFINELKAGYYNGSSDYPTNIHWNHLDDFGSTRRGESGWFDSDYDGDVDSFQSCPACHNVHGTNYPKMTRNEIAITYSSDSNGTFGYIGSNDYNDLNVCLSCHGSGPIFKYYRNEINVFDDCIYCHVPGDVNTSKFARHANINISDGLGIVTNNDCWTCHYQEDMNKSNVYLCESCHSNTSGIVQISDPALIMSGFMHGTTACKTCHAPAGYHQQGSTGPLGLVEKILNKIS